MHELTSLEIGLVVRELKPMEGSRIRKFYDLGNNAFKIALYKSSATRLVYVKLLKTINETKFSEQADKSTQFAMSMRKRIENSVVDSITQVNSDRIVSLDIDKGKYRLVIEMYAKGNMLLVNSGSMVEVSFRRTSGSRQISPGMKYDYPVGAYEDLFTIDRQKASSIAEGIAIDKSLINALSKRLSIGPMYLEDIITRAGLSPLAKQISEVERAALADQILAFVKRLSDEKPRIYLDAQGLTAEYAACGISKFEGLAKTEFDGMSPLLDALYLEERSSLPDTARQERLKELSLNIEKQEQLAERLAQESVEDADYGRRILENMAGINALCAYLRENRRATLQEVRAAFPNLKVKALDLKNKTVNVDIS